MISRISWCLNIQHLKTCKIGFAITIPSTLFTTQAGGRKHINLTLVHADYGQRGKRWIFAGKRAEPCYSSKWYSRVWYSRWYSRSRATIRFRMWCRSSQRPALEDCSLGDARWPTDSPGNICGLRTLSSWVWCISTPPTPKDPDCNEIAYTSGLDTPVSRRPHSRYDTRNSLTYLDRLDRALLAYAVYDLSSLPTSVTLAYASTTLTDRAMLWC